ncbi:hypothetical protein K1T71_014453 [Dendrolimus kikuchii]|uniref:Uncharacterized protein n=1 Tax=Dendrolimus kikuchii TaxID=765133 RepID=A0ACC1CE50_9NEOP|nr:hypothetical protein K1T71_014453 [Dendrolimus kikuchii]
MKPTPRRTTKPRNEVKKDETPSSSKKEEKKTTPSTPRNFVQKSSTADIYGQRKQSNVHVPKTPKKIQGVSKTASNVSPMKDLLKASPSTVRVTKPAKVPKDIQPPRGGKTGKDLPVLNVTVNSPITKRKLLNEEINKEKSKNTHVIQSKNSQDKSVRKSEERNVDLSSKSVKTREGSMHVFERQRTKTRTLDESEVKILTTESIDNNKEMLNLSQKLKAKPKAFFVELEDDKTKMKTEKSSDEEISYEDDFESYESDFESYHSDENGDEESLESDKEIHQNDEETLKEDDVEVDQSHVKDVKDEKDEERMLDSGSYDLRDRSAKSKPAVMEFILEDSEDPNDKKTSFTDEGFLEMSSSSAVSSLKTIHVEVLDRPLFIDFTKSKENKRKRLINERFKQRARDLLSMITLHEMSFVLFEMKPVSYDLYMATFGRCNYTQTAVQTFDDGINVEIQTDMVDNRHVWTQYPVDFSKSNITIQKTVDARKYSRDTQELLNQFTFLNENIKKETLDTVIDKDLVYESNPLRIYFEQKDGVGTTEMLPYETYNKKIKNTEHNSDRLRKFLKKFEGRVSNILNFNAGNIELSGLKNSRLSCSKGYVSISNKTIEDDKYSYLKRSKINKIIYSRTKNNLLFTICNKKENFKRCIICLWDINVARKDPIKILIAIDNVKYAEHTGSTDGIFIASLDDG